VHRVSRGWNHIGGRGDIGIIMLYPVGHIIFRRHWQWHIHIQLSVLKIRPPGGFILPAPTGQ